MIYYLLFHSCEGRNRIIVFLIIILLFAELVEAQKKPVKLKT